MGPLEHNQLEISDFFSSNGVTMLSFIMKMSAPWHVPCPVFLIYRRRKTRSNASLSSLHLIRRIQMWNFYIFR